jgi:hypothetical protein
VQALVSACGFGGSFFEHVRRPDATDPCVRLASSGEWLIGRIYERNGFPDELSLFAIPYPARLRQDIPGRE